MLAGLKRRAPACALVLLCLFAVTQLAQPPSRLTDMLTQHNDNSRTGANLTETVLTSTTVNKDRFGKLLDVPVDGFIYAQPLVVSALRIQGRARNVLFVETEHNSVYALDADTGQQLWTRNYGPSMPTPSAYFPSVSSNIPYRDLDPEIGITSTPVIDRGTRTMYFTSFVQTREAAGSAENNAPSASWHHYLHAVDLEDGSEKFHGPAEIRACVTSPLAVAVMQGKLHKGRHSVVTQLCFDPMQHLQRPAVLLVKPAGGHGQVVLAFGGHADYPVYHGWVMSYQADDITKQLGVWVSNTDNSPGNSGGGIWQSGMGLALDENNNFYLMTGNGYFDHDTAFGESFLRFSTAGNTIKLTSYFAPCNIAALDKDDVDVGSSGPLLLADRTLNPRPHYVVGGGKQGRIYLLDKDNLGGFAPKCDANGHDPQAPQEFQAIRSPASLSHHIHGSPVYWKSRVRGPVIYVWGENDHLRAYPLVLQNGRDWRFNTAPPAWAVGADLAPAHPWNPKASMMTGGMLSISANGDQDGIVWATTGTNNDANVKAVPGILRAYDATDLTKELWNSYQNYPSDDLGNFAKFTPVTVANGKVYVPTFSMQLSIYGPRSPTPNPATPLSFVRNPGFETGTGSWRGTANRFLAIPNFTYLGRLSGALCTNQSLLKGMSDVCPATVPPGAQDAELSQTISAPRSGRYQLKALCATNIYKSPWVARKDVLLGVDAGGTKAGERAIRPNAGYQRYTIDFDAAQGQQIRIWYQAPAAQTEGPVQMKLITPDAWAVIDEVELAIR